MVTRTVICVSPSEAATLAAKASWVSAEAHSIIKNASIATTPLPNGSDNKSDGGKKRALPSEDEISGNESKKRLKKADGFEIDLSDVPPLLPILKSADRVKEGSSKYTGVSFSKANNKWKAQITIEGTNRHIGYYENEEEAAIDYAKALFKYKGQGAVDKAREMKKSAPAINIDLSDVAPQLPILKRAGHIKEGASKYTGVNLRNQGNKLQAQRKERTIGNCENEEEAAVDYAGAQIKFRREDELVKVRERNELETVVHMSQFFFNGFVPRVIGCNSVRNHLPSEDIIDSEAKEKRQKADSFVLNLSDVPAQLPIPKSKGHIKEGASKYVGTHFNKTNNKWMAQIWIEGKNRSIGSYESEGLAAIDYARAVFKYKGKYALDKARQQNLCGSVPLIDLSDFLPQLPIPAHTGVSFNKTMNKWEARIMIEGKKHCIGYYESEEKALLFINYARAVFKYKGEGMKEA